jgi:hypothetical protein
MLEAAVKQVAFQMLDYAEFERLVQESTGRKEFDVQEEDTIDFTSKSGTSWKPNALHVYEDVRCEPAYSMYSEHSPAFIKARFDDNTNHVQDWLDGKCKHFPGVEQMLQWLCVHGYIQPGNYMIRVSW